MKRVLLRPACRFLRAVACGAILGVAFAPAALALDPAAPGSHGTEEQAPAPRGNDQTAPGKGESVGPPPGEDIGNRDKLLDNLYTRLGEAQDEENAKAIAAAIEKIWARSGSDTIDLLMSRAGKLIQEKDLDIAITILDSVVKIAPDYAEGWNRRAAVNYMKGNYRDSIEDLRHALALDPQHFEAIKGLGMLMLELGDKKSALRAFRKLLEVHPFLDEVRRRVNELSREVEGQPI